MALNAEMKKKLGVVTNVPKIDWFNYKGIIIAPPKFGKTTIASEVPNSVLLAFEKGYDSVKIDARDIADWSDFIEFIDTLEENISEIKDDLRLLMFDTAHKAWEMCTEYTLTKCNREKGKRYARIQNVPYAEGLDRRDEEFRKQLDRLDKLGIKWIMFGHTVEKKINKEGEEPYTVIEHDFEKRLADIIVKEASYLLIGENIVIKEEDDEDGNPTYSYKRKFISKNDGLNKAGGRIYIGEDIHFDTEAEFIEKYSRMFEEKIKEKNNISDKESEKMIETEKKEVMENRQKVAEEKKEENDKEELVSKIKENMRNLTPEKRKEILNSLLENYGSNKISVLDSRNVTELKKILKETE